MEIKTLNWGLLSTARINRKLIPAFKNSSRNNLLGVASRSFEKAKAYASEKGISKAYGSYEEMLDDPNIHVVYNPLPNHLHAEWTIKALKAGKHVLCEKPLALTLAEVDKIAETSLQTGKVVAEAFMYRHHPKTLKVKSLIDAGFIGHVKQIFGTFSYFMPYENGNVRWNPNWGGGSLWDVGCYPVSFARAIMGTEPLELEGWQQSSPSGVDESFSGMMRFPHSSEQDSCILSFSCSFRSVYHSWMQFVGEKGTLFVPTPFTSHRYSWLFHWNGSSYRPILIPGKSLYLGEIEDIASAVLENKPTRISLTDSRFNTAVLLGLYQSAQQNRPVKLSEINQ